MPSRRWPARSAADMPRLPAAPAAARLSSAPHATSDSFSGWYLRGDLGYRWGAHRRRAIGAPALPHHRRQARQRRRSAASAPASRPIGCAPTSPSISASPMKYDGTILTPGDTTAKMSAITRAVQRLSRSRHLVPHDALYRRRRRRRLHARLPITPAPRRRRFPATSHAANGISPGPAMAGVGYAISPNMHGRCRLPLHQFRRCHDRQRCFRQHDASRTSPRMKCALACVGVSMICPYRTSRGGSRMTAARAAGGAVCAARRRLRC